ncbi:MAG: hypothetical protein JWR23_3369 [Mucilaginibacter sp.]|nr:hypothetical protein [Mucilaginibacter sp.]
MFFIVSLVAILIVAVFLFFHFRNSRKSEITEVKQFLARFNKIIAEGSLDSLNTCFWQGKKAPSIEKLIQYLPTIDGDDITLKVELNVEASEIIKNNSDEIEVKVPLVLIYKPFKPKPSFLILTLRKTNTNQFKISQADVKQFITDYTAYINFVEKDEILKQAASFDPITLASLKTASHLKTNYDSVVWFQHINDKTYYFVVKGKLNTYFMFPDMAKENHDDKPTYKMGLVNPELKEIIPAEYDLIHNINGTIDGLIEVEKNDKKGFYNLEGKKIAEVKYDQIIPLNDPENVAVLKNGNDFFYLKADLTISEKLPDFKIVTIIPKVKYLNETFTLNNSRSKNIIEFNSITANNSIIISPSYLVDMQLAPKFIYLQNTLRHTDKSDSDFDSEADSDDLIYYTMSYQNYVKNEDNWFDNIYFSLLSKDHSQINEKKNVIVVDKRANKLYGTTINPELTFQSEKEKEENDNKCNENSFRAINDTLFEFKTTSSLNGVPFCEINTGPRYYYSHLTNGKMEEVITEGWFKFTKYVKIDDSYLKGCYDGKNSYPNMTMTSWMLYEMYDRYGYKPTDYSLIDKNNKPANKIYNETFSDIEKYNMQWLNKKVEQMEKSK